MKLSRIFRLFYRLLLTIIFLLSLPVLCHAANNGFTFEEKAISGYLTIVSKLNIQPVESTTNRKGFCCFAVTPNGKYALGFDYAEREELLVFNDKGEYLYGFSFNNDGAWGVGWEGNNTVLFCVRSDLAITVDGNGECVEVKDIKEDSENYDYWNHEVFSNTREVNGVVYTAKHWLFNSPLIRWGQYPMLIKTLPTGESIILYDAFEGYLISVPFILTITGLPLVVTIFIYCIYRRSHKKR